MQSQERGRSGVSGLECPIATLLEIITRAIEGNVIAVVMDALEPTTHES